MLVPKVPTADTRIVRPAATRRLPKIADAFYSSAVWIALRDQVRRESGGMCEWPGCKERGQRIDHKLERKDRPDLALVRSNLWNLCPSHDGRKTAEEKRIRGGDVPASNHPEWLLPSAIPLLIVCGPPASGKTTWAREQLAGRGELIDLDEIMAELSGLPLYQAGREWLNPAVRQRNNMLGSLSRRPKWQRAALIVGEPSAERREWWAEKLRPTRVVVMETPEDVCIQRLNADPRRTSRGIELATAIHEWWSRYTRRPGDVVVTRGDQGFSKKFGGLLATSGAPSVRNFSGSAKFGTGER